MRLAAALFLILFLLAPPASGLQPVVAGPNDPPYFPLAQKMAEQGCAEEQRSLGDAYRFGEYGLQKDIVEAIKWYRRAAAQDDWWAQEDIGVLYEKGEGVPQDYAEAYFWYVLSFVKGYRPNMGDWPALKGRRVSDKLTPKQKSAVEKHADEWKAVREINLLPDQIAVLPIDWFPGSDHKRKEDQLLIIKNKAQQGDPYFQATLANMYYGGLWVQQDYSEAAKWYHAAAEQGNVGAIDKLGDMYAKGQGVKEDWQEAYAWLRIAAPCHRYQHMSPSDAAKHLTSEQKAAIDKRVAAWFATPSGSPQP